MKPPVKSAEKFKNFLFNKFSNDLAGMLLLTGTLGWIFSAAGQVFGIATNKKVSKDKKRFLIPQEMADAAINILSFYFVTRTIQGQAKKLVSSGKVITPEIKKFCENNGISLIKDGNKKINIGKSILDKIKALESAKELSNDKEIALNLTENKVQQIDNKIKELNEFYDNKYARYETGFNVIGNVIGAVVSSNIITPLLRNPIAAYKQKQLIEKENMQKDQNNQQTNEPAQITQINQNKYKSNVYPSKVLTNSGNMKI